MVLGGGDDCRCSRAVPLNRFSRKNRLDTFWSCNFLSLTLDNLYCYYSSLLGAAIVVCYCQAWLMVYQLLHLCLFVVSSKQ